MRSIVERCHHYHILASKSHISFSDIGYKSRRWHHDRVDSADDVTPALDHAALWRDFVTPPDEARPRAWWHWMDGNIDPAGIRRDLAWLQRVGVRGVQLFDGGMGVPPVVSAPVRPGTAAWAEAIDTAVATAEDLGLELAVATSSGWSAAGGPWVAPEDAMKKVVWSETIVDGTMTEVALRPLPAVAGLYQDSPREGGHPAPDFAVDAVVMALPHRPESTVLRPADVAASVELTSWEALVDGSFGDAVALPREPDGWSEAWIEQRFDHPVVVRSVTLGLPGARGFGAAPAADAVLRVSDDGVTYRDVAHLDPTTVPARTASFAPVRGTHFRLVLSGASAADALPPTAPGVRLPPVLRRAHEFRVSEFALRTDARVHHAEVKAGFGVVPDYHAVAGVVDAGAIAPGDVIDVTAHVRDGMLRWTAPTGGPWLILRIGASLTGQTNGPAPADSTGLEVDKLDGARVAAYLSTHLARFGGSDDTPARFAALLSDSIEAGPQNWTDAIGAEFAARRGYDPAPWWPALTGILVGGAAASDRFLYDYRRTLAELLAEQYYGTLAAEAHRRGMVAYAEALEDRRPSLGDDLAMRTPADVPMGAMWTFAPDDGPAPTYVADLRGAASVAHVHGKRWVGSEAFTSFDSPWSWTPRTLKHIADLQLSLGVTRFCLHTSPHQPLAAPPPGIALAPFLGQSFTVHETWADMAGPWIDYLARSRTVLGAGRPDVEVAVFVGEEAPVTGLFADAYDTAVPEGIGYDYVGPDALARVLRVEEGRIVADGADYSVLLLAGSSSRMTLAALAAIERLVAAGATVGGPRPGTSPSLADDPERVREVIARLWDGGGVDGRDLAAVLAERGTAPAVRLDGPPVRRISRRWGSAVVTFVANPTTAPIALHVHAAGALEVWDPVRVRRMPLRPADTPAETTPLTLAPFEAVFLVPVERSEGPADGAFSEQDIALRGPWRVQVPGLPEHASTPDPRLWTAEGAAARGYSGIGVYRHTVHLSAAELEGATATLVLTDVRDIARVVIDGVEAGIVWTAPFELDVTDLLRPGSVTIEVHVATPWRNRLIAEARSTTGEIFVPMTAVFTADAEPLPAGLTGAAWLRLRRPAAGMPRSVSR